MGRSPVSCNYYASGRARARRKSALTWAALPGGLARNAVRAPINESLVLTQIPGRGRPADRNCLPWRPGRRSSMIPDSEATSASATQRSGDTMLARRGARKPAADASAANTRNKESIMRVMTVLAVRHHGNTAKVLG